MKLQKTLLAYLQLMLLLQPVAKADPCGMVPPILVADGNPIERVGLQKTYLFFKDGVETLVLRPGFTGSVEEFGMLIPFPSPPAIRKVADDVFAHVAAAIDPPEVVMDLRWERLASLGYRGSTSAVAGAVDAGLREQELVVLNEEAVGMYQVAVLAAGSAQALKDWMEEHGFRYPEGMDKTCEEYVREGWCFVAVKARVGQMAAAEARPGMRTVDPSSPPGAGFDGHVQAMGFRFLVDQPVVPMRLSAFNAGELHNVIYALTDIPCRVAQLPTGMVVRQVSGAQLLEHLTQPVPLRILGGDEEDLDDRQRENLVRQRDPRQYNGIARELFATDLMAARSRRLTHLFEEHQKQLLSIGEDLLLRGPAYDAVIERALAEQREEIIQAALADLEGMTLTVMDGVFPRDVLARSNLTFPAFTMPEEENQRDLYDARHFGPAPALGGSLSAGPGPLGGSGAKAAAGYALLIALGIVFLGAVAIAQRRSRHQAWVRSSVLGFVLLATLWPSARAESGLPRPRASGQSGGPTTTQHDLVARGHQIVAMSLMDGPSVRPELRRQRDEEQSELVIAWLNAALARSAEGIWQLIELEPWMAGGLLDRPIRMRAEVLLSNSDRTPTHVALAALDRSWHCQRLLAPLMTAREPRDLVRGMLQAETDSARRLAAGYLAGRAAQDPEGVRLEVLGALAFHPSAEDVPWRGGALFLPSLPWSTLEARILVREFVSWMDWCEKRGRVGDVSKLQNNLRSVGLCRTAGFGLPSGQDSAQASLWLEAYGNSFGELELERLLAGLDGGDK